MEGLRDFVQAGTGAVTKTAQEKARETVSVLDFYANGVSGVAVDPTGAVDSTLGIQAAATHVGYGGVIVFPKGTYLVSSTITLRGATKLIGYGPETTIIYRTGNYGDTFLCGTTDLSEPARNFSAKGIRFLHSIPFSYGDTSLANKATSGAHIHLRGAQEAEISNCWIHRLPYGVRSEGGSWVKIQNCQFLGTYDLSTVALQETIYQLWAQWSSVHGIPTTWVVINNNFLGSTALRNITYTPSSGSVVVNRIDTMGALFGFFIDGLEDLVCSNNYFGGHSTAEIGVINVSGGAVIDLRISDNFFDGISQGNGILFAPTVSNLFSLGVSIKNNFFVDNFHAVYINVNAGSSTPSVYNLNMSGNICFSGIATQFMLTGVKGFTVKQNNITDYNKHNLSSTDQIYTAAMYVAGVASSGSISDNTLGGGGNTLLNTTGTNYCYAGIVIDASILTVHSGGNFSNGLRIGSNFYTGMSIDENQKILTASGNYVLSSAESVFIANKTVSQATVVWLQPYPVVGREQTVIDGKGDASGYNITIGTTDSTLINGAGSALITTNYGYMKFRFNGTQWNRIV